MSKTRDVKYAEIEQNVKKRAAATVTHMWRSWGDYITAMGDNLSKLNDQAYTLETLDKENKEWHEDLAVHARGLPNQEGTIILSLEKLGKKWKDWKWLDLETSFCLEEGKSMGHCGNRAHEEGDTIVSLRDPEGYAHLTFIINDGFLGESKGRGNQKPSKKYHKPIVELLKSDYIHVVKGGGNKPLNNFEMSDLHDDYNKELKHKNLDNPNTNLNI